MDTQILQERAEEPLLGKQCEENQQPATPQHTAQARTHPINETTKKDSNRILQVSSLGLNVQRVS